MQAVTTVACAAQQLEEAREVAINHTIGGATATTAVCPGCRCCKVLDPLAPASRERDDVSTEAPLAVAQFHLRDRVRVLESQLAVRSTQGVSVPKWHVLCVYVLVSAECNSEFRRPPSVYTQPVVSACISRKPSHEYLLG
jgi:hypothetical protein